MENVQEPYPTAGKSSEDNSLEPETSSLQLQTQNREVSLHNAHGFKALSWPPMSVMEQPSTFPQPSLPSPSQNPLFITAGRPIVILPKEYSLPTCVPDASLGTTRSSALYFQPICTSVTELRDTPAPLIAPVNDNMEVIPARPIARAIEFSNVQQIAHEPREIIQHKKEEQPIADVDSTLRESKVQATTEEAYLDIPQSPDTSKSQEIDTIPSSAPIADVSITALPELTQYSDESMDHNIKLSLSFPSSSCPQSQSLDQLELPLQKSTTRVSPLIMSCYEESKEQLVLDDSDSELEMPECSNKSEACSLSCRETDNENQTVLKDASVSSQVHDDSNTNMEPLSSDIELESSKNVVMTQARDCSFAETIPTNNISSQTVPDLPLPLANPLEPASSQADDSSINVEPLSSENVVESQRRDYNVTELVPQQSVSTGDEAKSPSSVCKPPPLKRAKMSDPSTDDVDKSVCERSTFLQTESRSNQDILVDNSCEITEPNKISGQTVPDLPLPLTNSLDVSQPNEIRSPPVNVQDGSIKLEYPQEPVDVASDGIDTVDQMLPTESAREHAMVPNMVRCANDQSDKDRDEPNDDDNDDDGSSCARLRAWVPTLHRSRREIPKNLQVSAIDECMPGQTVVELKLSGEDRLPREVHLPGGSTDISTKTILSKVYTSAVVPTMTTIESAQPFTEHQIVPEESFSNTTLSSQSLYTDLHDKSENCYPVLQDETDIEQLDNSLISNMILKSVEMKKSGQTCLSRSDDQALPESPPQGNDHCTPVNKEQTSIGAYSRHNYSQSLFGFQHGKHAPQSQGPGTTVATTRLNLGRPQLRLGLSKRQQCTPLHK